MSRNIVITGTGCCIALGVPSGQLLEEIWARSDASSIYRRVKISDDLALGEEESLTAVLGPDPTLIREFRRPFPDRPTLMAVVALDQALTAAGLDTHVSGGDSFGLVLNTCVGRNFKVERFLRTLLQQGPSSERHCIFACRIQRNGRRTRSRAQPARPSSTVLGSSAPIYGIDLLADECVEAIICIGVDEVRDLALWAYRQADWR